MGGAAAAAAGAAAARARRRVISHFMSANAVSPDRAVPFTGDRAIEQRFFERMRDAGVILPAGNGGYYLDVAQYDAWQQAQRARVKWIVLIGVIALAIGILVGVLVPHK